MTTNPDTTEEEYAFNRGLHSGNKDTERLMDELDHLLATKVVDEDTASKIIQIAYRLAER
jgi:hypothetical protein